MYEFLVGIPPFNDTTVEKIFDNIVNMRMEWPSIGEGDDCISPEAAELIKNLLNMDYNERLGARGVEEIKNAPFFKGIDWRNLRKKNGLIIPKMIRSEEG